VLKNNTEVRWVRDGSPAMRAGVSAKDVIVAIDGLKAGSDAEARLSDLAPGEVVRLHVFRRDELQELDVVVGKAVLDTVFLTADPAADDAALARRREWLGVG
jgi:predicted metalloprotease with PDZ domain